MTWAKRKPWWFPVPKVRSPKAPRSINSRPAACVDCGIELQVNLGPGATPRRCLHCRQTRDAARCRRSYDPEKYRRRYLANRSANKLRSTNRRAAYRAVTLPAAKMTRLTWSAAEDAAILRSELRTLELALALGRTFNEVEHRRRDLRRGRSDDRTPRRCECGNTFTPRSGARYCSGACRRKSYHAVRASRIREDPSLAPHGVVQTFKGWGCRCEPCAEANRADCAVRYRRRRAADGRPYRPRWRWPTQEQQQPAVNGS